MLSEEAIEVINKESYKSWDLPVERQLMDFGTAS